MTYSKNLLKFSEFNEQTETLAESSLSRIYRDFMENEFIIITSWRVGDSENKSNLSDMKNYLRSKDLGYVRIDGVGQEETEDGKVVATKEPSLLVKNVQKGGEKKYESAEFSKILYDLAKKYDQWGIVHHDPTNGTRLVAFKDDQGKSIPSGKVVNKMKSFQPMKVAQFFSSLKGKPFTFESFQYSSPSNFIEGMSRTKEGEEFVYYRKNK